MFHDVALLRLIPGCQRLEENMGALNLKISAEDVMELRRLCENANIGDRYNNAGMQKCLQETPLLVNPLNKKV